MARGVVRINQYQQRTTPHGQAQPYQRAVDITGNGALARTLGEASGALEDKVDELSRANAAELDNELSRRIRERMLNPETGYLSTARGGAASARRPEIEEQLRADAAEIAATARNTRSQRMFEDVAARRLSQELDRVAAHDATETRSYLNEQTETRINEFMDNAVAAYDNPAYVQDQRNGILAELKELRQRNGWSDDTYQYRVRQAQSDMSQRVIIQLAETDPAAAEEYFNMVAPTLTAEDRAGLRTTMTNARRQAEDNLIDEAWVHVSNGARPPSELWNRLPGRARIDIQNEMRRRAEGGAGTGDRTLIEDLRVMAIANPDMFARADLRAVRSQLGSYYDELAIAQAQVRQGERPPTVEQQRTTFNALQAIAQTTLNLDLSPTEGAPAAQRNRASAYNAALLREVEQFHANNPGVALDAETAQQIIGRAWVSMRGAGVDRDQGRVEGDRGRTRRSAVAPTSEVNVPYARIPTDHALRVGTILQRRLGRVPTQGEVENAYSAILQGRDLNDVMRPQ